MRPKRQKNTTPNAISERSRHLIHALGGEVGQELEEAPVGAVHRAALDIQGTNPRKRHERARWGQEESTKEEGNSKQHLRAPFPCRSCRPGARRTRRSCRPHCTCKSKQGRSGRRQQLNAAVITTTQARRHTRRAPLWEKERKRPNTREQQTTHTHTGHLR